VGEPVSARKDTFVAKAEPLPGERYRALIKPIWRSVNIYDGPAIFLLQFNAIPPEGGNLFAGHWCQSEVRNGGFHQFFTNSTGVLAPEALRGYRAMGLRTWAAILAEAMDFFGHDYPRDQSDRIHTLESVRASTPDDWNPFRELDRRFFEWLRGEKNRWEVAADKYAGSVGN
jgi:hypothetical protein